MRARWVLHPLKYIVLNSFIRPTAWLLEPPNDQWVLQRCCVQAFLDQNLNEFHLKCKYHREIVQNDCRNPMILLNWSLSRKDLFNIWIFALFKQKYISWYVFNGCKKPTGRHATLITAATPTGHYFKWFVLNDLWYFVWTHVVNKNTTTTTIQICHKNS